MLGLVDIDRNFITAFGESKITIYTQIMGPLLHAMFLYILLYPCDLGISGIGYAAFFTNSTIFCV